jgi:hypothetical protein
MNFLMKVVIVLFCNCQLLLKLNLLSPQDVLFVLGFIPLVQHMDQHAPTVAMSDYQPLNRKCFLISFMCHLLQKLLDHLSLSNYLGQLRPQPFLHGRLRTGLTRS